MGWVKPKNHLTLLSLKAPLFTTKVEVVPRFFNKAARLSVLCILTYFLNHSNRIIYLKAIPIFAMQKQDQPCIKDCVRKSFKPSKTQRQIVMENIYIYFLSSHWVHTWSTHLSHQLALGSFCVQRCCTERRKIKRQVGRCCGELKREGAEDPMTNETTTNKKCGPLMQYQCTCIYSLCYFSDNCSFSPRHEVSSQTKTIFT